jgi:AcrR family transcriptional regulator
MRAAVSVFAQDGYEAGSVNDVAVKAGLSRPNLLYYYPSKRELLLAVLDARDADLNRALHFADPARYATIREYVDDLSGLLPTIYGDRELVGMYHRLVAEVADPNHPARDWVLARHARIRSNYAQMTRAAIARGELRSDLDADGLAVAVLGAIEGIESQWLINPSVDWVAATGALRALLDLAST